MINWLIIGKFIVLNHWCQLLNVRASFTVKGNYKADLVSRRHDIHPDDVHMRRPDEMFALWWDGKVPDLCYQCNETSLLVLSADTVSVDDDFLTNWKFLVFLFRWWINARWKGHGLTRSSNGLYTHHGRLFIPRLAQDLCILLLSECSYNVGHQEWQHMLTTLWNVSCGNVYILLDCKALSSNCDVCKRLKPISQGSFALYPLVLLTIHGKYWFGFCH